MRGNTVGALVVLCAGFLHVSGTVISNLNVIFETFGPLSMVRFFEFNDIGWNISENCIKDMFLYLDGLHKDVVWAVKLYDASGYYSGSIYAGNNIRQANPQLCRDMNEAALTNQYQSLITNHTRSENMQDFTNLSKRLPFAVQLVNLKYKTAIGSSSFRSYIIHQTVCMPKSCTYDDLMQVMSYANLPHLRNNLIMQNAELLQVKVLKESYQFYKDSGFYIFAGLTSIFVFLGFVGTIFESFANIETKRENSYQNAIDTNILLATRLNDLKNRTTNYKNTEHIMNNKEYLKVLKIDDINGTESMPRENVNVVHMNEIKMENISTISVNILSTKCAKSKHWSNEVALKPLQQSTLPKMLLAFSWNKNYRILFSDAQRYCINDVIEVAGLRVLCLLWILLVHVCTVLYYVSDNKIYRNSSDSMNLLQRVLNSGSLAIDTHFFLCGVCIAQMFFNRMKNIDMEAICSCFDTLLHISAMTVFKIFGMTFPYAASLLLLHMFMKYFHDFGIIDIPSLDHLTCTANMWRNIFYIDQFYPLEERCMIWSWMLSLEIQFFIVASIVLLILKNHPRYGIIIFCSFLISSFVATTKLRFYGHSADLKTNSSLIYDEHLAFYNGLYDQPWARLSPYFFGICMGYILHKTEKIININIIIVSCGWIACLLIMIALIFSKSFFRFSSHWMDATLSTISHTVWSMILVWIIVASISKYRGFIGRLLTAKSLLPFSKMTNCFLIVHPLVTRVILLSSDGSFHLSIGLIMTMYLGFVILTVFCSFLLYMIYEAPVEELLRIVYNRKME